MEENGLKRDSLADSLAKFDLVQLLESNFKGKRSCMQPMYLYDHDALWLYHIDEV